MSTRKKYTAKKVKPKPKPPPPRKPKPRPRPKKKDDCFITTACVDFYGLSENCKQLQILRRFRDEHLLKSKDGFDLIKQYYSIAPSLVCKLKKDDASKKIFNLIFNKINLACEEIGNSNYSSATEIYKSIVKFLLKRYT